MPTDKQAPHVQCLVWGLLCGTIFTYLLQRFGHVG